VYWINTIIQGALVGGLYALFATGLSLMFGVMRIINIAHGDFIVMSAYLAVVVVGLLGVDPLVSLAVVVPVMFGIGYALQRGLLNFTLGDDILRPLLVTFGLSVVIQNGLLELFSADSRRLQLPWLETASVRIGDQLAIGLMPATVFVVAVVVIAALELLLYWTDLGRAFRATADDSDTARLYGVNNRYIYAMATAIALSVMSIAGVLFGISYHFRSDDRSGPAPLRIRGGDYRRPGQPVGNVGRRCHSRSSAGPRRGVRSKLGYTCRTPRVSIRPAGAAARAHSEDRRPMSDIPSYRIERSTGTSRLGFAILLVALVALLSLPGWAGRAEMRLLIEISYYLALAQVWNLLAGYAGLVSVGQQAYVGLGCYVFLAATAFLNVPPLPALLLTGFAVTMIAVPVAFVAFRLRGAHFAIGTWVIAEVLRLIFTLIRPFGQGTGMSLPISVVRAISENRTARELILYYFSVGLGVGSVVLVFFWLRSRQGLALAAVRDSEAAAGSIGINQQRTKLAVYLIAALIAGLVGALVILEKLRITPAAAFSVTDWSADVIFIVVIGGIGSIEGPIIGTLVFFVLRALLADYGAWYLITLGTIAIVVMLKAPRGLWGLIGEGHNVHLFPVQRRVRFDANRQPIRALGK